MTTRSDVRFMADGGIELGAWLFLPASARLPSPAITMAHGYAGVREHGIAKFAEAFADAGFVVLLHDHRTFGVSGGEPRQDVDPWRQIADWRRAISYLESRPEVDSSRIGLWGTSYAGGHARCWAPPNDVLPVWSPRSRRSADTSKVFVALHQRPFPPWRRR